jgi:hypothetical protein
MRDPNNEMKRIREDLIACGVDVPRDATLEEVAEFVDIKLQHGIYTYIYRNLK